MVNFAELKARRDAELQAKAAAKEPASRILSDGSLRRSRHAFAAPRRSPEEVRELRRRMRLDATVGDLQRLEDQARTEANTADPADAAKNDVLPLSGLPPPPILVPPGRDRDLWAEEQRQAELQARIETPSVGLGDDLPPAVERTYRLLLAFGRRQPATPGWWRVSIAEVGADVLRVLGEEPDEPPWYGWNLTTRQQRLATPEERLAASHLLAQHLTELESQGLWRWIARPAWGELAIL